MIDTDVLIVGAGPTGLMLAGWLARLGVKAVVVDKKAGLSQETRALVVQARTLEVYDQLGLGEQAGAEGVHVNAISMMANGKPVSRAILGELGQGISPHPFVLALGQDQNEALLLAHLEAHGGAVQWETALSDLALARSGAMATLTGVQDQQTTVKARYVAGCDGAASAVRQSLGIGFQGGTYSERFFVADVEATGQIKPADFNVSLDDKRFAAFFPLKGVNHVRIVGLVPHECRDRPDLTLEDLRPEIERRFNVQISKTVWFSTYHSHHRVANSFQVGNAFLLGDAAHVHSPMGGQGMNTGLMDASNLAWKLAAVIHGHAKEDLLESYAAERMPFARALVNTTDRLFGTIVADNVLGYLMRTQIMPRLFPAVATHPALARWAFLTISQIGINYREGPLSRGRVGRIHSGDRLPWVRFPDGKSNFDPLQTLKPQLHVFGAAETALKTWREQVPTLEIYGFPLSPEAAQKGFLAGAAYLVRPDGYVGYAAPTVRPRDLHAYLREVWGDPRI